MTRKVLLAAAGSVVLVGLIWGIAAGVARIVGAVDDLGDADIGAGLIELAIPFLAIPFALAFWLDRIDVRGAGPIGMLGFVVYVIAFFTLDAPALTGPLATPLVSVATFGVYATLATAISAAVPQRPEKREIL